MRLPPGGRRHEGLNVCQTVIQAGELDIEQVDFSKVHLFTRIMAGMLCTFLCTSVLSAQDSTVTLPSPASGLFFTGGFVKGGNGNGGGIQPWLGPGWRFGGAWSVAIHFQTGHLIVDSASGRPTHGNLFFGGALLELQYEGTAEGIHPLFGIAGGLATALTRDGVGYNGAQAGILAGGSWNVSRTFRASIAAEVMRRWWMNGVGDAAQAMNAFPVTSPGVHIELVFFPGIDL